MSRSVKKSAKKKPAAKKPPPGEAPSSLKPDVDMLLTDFMNLADVQTANPGNARERRFSYVHGFTDALVLIRVRMASMLPPELRVFIQREEKRAQSLADGLFAEKLLTPPKDGNTVASKEDNAT